MQALSVLSPSRLLGSLLFLLLLGAGVAAPVQAQQASTTKLTPAGGPRRAPAPDAETTWYLLFDIKDAVTKQQLPSVPAAVTGPGASWSGNVRPGTTIDQGSWVGPFAPGTYRVELRPGGYAVASASFTLERMKDLPPDQRGPFSGKRITWQLQKAAAAQGTLVVVVIAADTQAPINGASVSVAGPGGTRSGTTGTEQRTAVFGGLPFGTYTVTASVPGYDSQSVQVSITAPPPMSQRIVVRRAGGNVALRVRMQSPEGAPVAGAGVSASGPGGTVSGTTGGDGVATLLVRPGTYTVTYTAPGSPPRELRGVTAPTPPAGIVISLSRPPLRVIVTDDQGRPVAGAAVKAARGGASPQDVGRTDGAGSAMVALPPGEYTMTAEAPGYTAWGKTGTVTIPGSSGAAIVLKRAAQLTVFRVTVSDERGRPIPGASVKVTSQSTASAPPRTATSDAAGLATFTLAVEDYTFVVEAPGYERRVVSNVRAAQITAGSLTIGGLSRSGVRVQVRIRDDRGPVAGATVRASGSAGTFNGTTDGAGVATLTVPSSGVSTFSAEAPGHSPVSRQGVSVLDAERAGLDLPIQRVVAGELEVLVTTERANKVIPGASVTVGSLRGVTDARGRVVLATGAGKFTVIVQVPGYAPVHKPVSVNGRESVWIDLPKK